MLRNGLSTAASFLEATRLYLLLLPLVIISLSTVFAHAQPDADARVDLSTGKRPNIVLIVADDLGWNDVGYHGSEIATPAIDDLARTSMQLDRFYAKVSCTPSRAALMTGVHPFRYGMASNVVQPWDKAGLPLDRTTIAEVLQRNGYHTAMVGKWHLGHWREDFLPTHRGFDTHYGHYCSDLDYFSHEHVKGGLDWHRNEVPVEEEGYATDLLAAEASQIIQAHTYEQSPLFLYVAFNAPHIPLQAQDQLQANYANIANPERQVYAAMVESFDHGVGEIVEALIENHEWENTLFIVTSDNGGGYRGAGGDNRPLRQAKSTIYEGGVRVPTLVSFPSQIPEPSVNASYYSVVDLFPTFLKVAGIEESTVSSLGLDGQSMLPFNQIQSPENLSIQDSDSQPQENLPQNLNSRGEIIIAINRENRNSALISPPYKYVWNPSNGWFDQEALYDLETDPGELNNVIGEHPELAEQMRSAVARYRAEMAPSILTSGSEVPRGFVMPTVLQPPNLQRLNSWSGWLNPSLWLEKLPGLSRKEVLGLSLVIGVGVGITLMLLGLALRRHLLFR